MCKENALGRVLRLGMVLVVTTGLAACAPEEEAELETPETETPDVETVEPIDVDIEGVNSTVSGEATITRTGESLMVMLTLENLPGQGPLQAQLISGRCDAIEGAAPPATPPQTTTPENESGRLIATLEAIQVTGQAPALSGTSHSNVPVSSIQGNTEATIQVTSEGGQTIACGNVNDLNEMTTASAGMTTPGSAPYGTPPATPAPSTTPAPGTRP